MTFTRHLRGFTIAKAATENTVPSLLVTGRILEKEAETLDIIDFWVAEMRKVSNIIDQIPADERPLVVQQNAASWQANFCCWPFGPYHFGRVPNSRAA